MDQSPKAKFLRAKYIARERERLWYWRVYVGLKTCCLPKKDNKLDETKDQEENIKSPNVSIPRLVEIQRIKEVHQVDCKQRQVIRRLVEAECDKAIRHMMVIHDEKEMNLLREIKYVDEIKNQERIKHIVQTEQEEHAKQDCKPAWARRRHYYNANSNEDGPKFGEEEILPNYKPSSVNHIDQGFKPWARRRHYYNQAQYEESTFSNSADVEVQPTSNPQDRSFEWARRRHYYNVGNDTIVDDTFKEEHKPWKRRRHYYNEGRNLTGSDVRATED